MPDTQTISLVLGKSQTFLVAYLISSNKKLTFSVGLQSKPRSRKCRNNLRHASTEILELDQIRILESKQKKKAETLKYLIAKALELLLIFISVFSTWLFGQGRKKSISFEWIWRL